MGGGYRTCADPEHFSGGWGWRRGGHCHLSVPGGGGSEAYFGQFDNLI